MRKIIKRALSMLVVLISILSITCPVYAKSVENDGFTVETFPNEEIEATLPDYLREALNSEVATCGTTKPSASSVYDLTAKGKYNFTVSTKLNTTIYSRYVFTGHDGEVKFYLNDTSTDSGSYKVKIYKKGLVDTTVYTKSNCPHDDVTSFYVSIDDVDAKIYFAIIPDGRTYLGSSSYIDKG